MDQPQGVLDVAGGGEPLVFGLGRQGGGRLASLAQAATRALTWRSSGVIGFTLPLHESM